MALSYYNEFDPYAAQWLKNLIAGGHISAGEVDSRSIKDVSSRDLEGKTRCHFFAGIAGWDLALQLAGWPADREVWTGSCPCQPFSAAGKRKGTADERHLWPEFLRLIDERRPSTIFGEQVASKDGRIWLAGVRSDLEALGYVVGAADLCAAGVGAPHIRQRLYWVAYSKGDAWERTIGRNDTGFDAGGGGPFGNGVAYSEQFGRGGRSNGDSPRHGRAIQIEGRGFWSNSELIPCLDGKARRIEPGTFPLAHGVPARVGKLRAYGNAIVPQVAAEFVRAFLND